MQQQPKRSEKVDVALTDEQLDRLRDLARGIPLSPFVRSVVAALARSPELANELGLHVQESGEPMFARVDVVLSAEELERLRELAGELPPSTYVRRVIRGLIARPARVAELLYGQHEPPPQPVAAG